ncbi:MAG: HAD family hydrolase [Gammaproteobacteria bacterium]
MNQSIIHALDFDGVICDSAVETAITGWKAASHIWNDMHTETPPALIEQFRLVRPIIETGYEAILAMRLLFLGVSCEAIYADYRSKNEQLMQQTPISIDDLKNLFGATRDHWIADDLDSWIAMNPLFSGVPEKLRKLGESADWYVITTKQERFVKQIFKANAIELADERIFGLDRNMNKTEVLKGLIGENQGVPIQFVEDRLPTLLNVKKHPELACVDLRFACWGYNTEQDKEQAKQQGFTMLNLDDFLR